MVKELKTTPWWPYQKGFPYQEDVLVAAAWLHDIIEDGEYVDGKPVGYEVFDGFRFGATDCLGGAQKLQRTITVVKAETSTAPQT